MNYVNGQHARGLQSIVRTMMSMKARGRGTNKHDAKRQRKNDGVNKFILLKIESIVITHTVYSPFTIIPYA